MTRDQLHEALMLDEELARIEALLADMNLGGPNARLGVTVAAGHQTALDPNEYGINLRYGGPIWHAVAKALIDRATTLKDELAKLGINGEGEAP